MVRTRKIFFLLCGLTFLVISYFGILMPGVPAIPFILLSGWFFLQSSDKLYQWMERRKIIGPVLRKFFSEGNVSVKMKWFVISQFWVSLVIAQIFFIHQLEYIVLINATGITGSILIYKLIK